MKIYHAFISAALLGAAFPAEADQASASTLSQRLSRTVRDQFVEPVWASDDTALYYPWGGTIIGVQTATGEKKPMLDKEAIANKTSDPSTRVERFALAENGDFMCLAITDSECLPLRIRDATIETVDPADDPFALTPYPLDAGIRSGGPNGDTTVYFVNNTDQPVDLYWLDSAGLRQSYGTVAPHSVRPQHTYAGHAWVAGTASFIATSDRSTAYVDARPEARPERRRPGRRESPRRESDWSVEFRDYNLSVTKRETGKTTRLTEDGTEARRYTGPAQVSPCGRYLLAFRETPGDGRTVDLISAAPPDQLQPKRITIPYDKPGDKLDQRKPYLFDLQEGKKIPIDDTLFPNPWSVSEFHWAPDGNRLFFVYNERGHQTLRLLAVQTETGKVRTVIEETSPTFIDYSSKLWLRHLDETDEVIWMSERSGWNHLYLVNRGTGECRAVTKGEWVVRGVEEIDPEKRELILRAGGILPEQDPCHIHYVRVGFDGSGLTMLTAGNGTHAVRFSPGKAFYVDTWSRVDQPPVHELRRSADGELVAELGSADISRLLAVHPYLPQPFTAKGRDGKTDIYGVIYRPSDFDPARKYAVIENIYAGPQDQHVPKGFRPYHGSQRLAECGFIVVQIDGMGTNWRSKKFHDVCWKNLKDAGFPDRIAWIRAAAGQVPSMDLSRIGVYGTSAGGQNAMRAVIDHADFYKAAYADCGCHDNRMDKVWWNEQWMGWPVDESYIENSNVVDAHKLGGTLLLTVGAMDSNVDPSSTMQVVDELIKANKDFELMVFPSSGHGAGMDTYGTRLYENFFIRHLQ